MAMGQFFFWAAAALTLPTAAVYVKQAPQRPPQHIPQALMAYESPHFLGNCAVPTEPAAREALLVGPSAQSAAPGPDMIAKWFMEHANGAVDFTGTWLLRGMTGDVDEVMMASGANAWALGIIRNLRYGAGMLQARIFQRGDKFSIKTSVRGTSAQELVTYKIGVAQPHEHNQTLCAYWKNESKTEFVLETSDPKRRVPTIHRYMQGPTMVMKVTYGKKQCLEYWDRIDNQISDVVENDQALENAIASLPLLSDEIEATSGTTS